MFQFQVLPVRGVPPPNGMVSPWKGRAHTQGYVGNSFMSRLCFTTQCAERSIPQGGEGKMMMCVLILPVCFTRPHGMFLVLYRVTNHMAGGPPPSLSETGTYMIYDI